MDRGVGLCNVGQAVNIVADQVFHHHI